MKKIPSGIVKSKVLDAVLATCWAIWIIKEQQGTSIDSHGSLPAVGKTSTTHSEGPPQFKSKTILLTEIESNYLLFSSMSFSCWNLITYSSVSMSVADLVGKL